MKIAPSLLAADFFHLEKEIAAVVAAGVEMLHLDVMDGHFVPNLTFGLPIISQIGKNVHLPMDVHLMVTNPDFYPEKLAESGVQYVSFHQETVYHSHRLVHQIKELGMKAGIALNPATPIETIYPLLSDLDFVLIMSVNPGYGGQKFLPLALEKIRNLYALRTQKGYDFEIEVDGGVNNKNAVLLQEAGTDILVAGSYIFQSNDYQKQVNNLKGSIYV